MLFTARVPSAQQAALLIVGQLVPVAPPSPPARQDLLPQDNGSVPLTPNQELVPEAVCHDLGNLEFAPALHFRLPSMLGLAVPPPRRASSRVKVRPRGFYLG